MNATTNNSGFHDVTLRHALLHADEARPPAYSSARPKTSVEFVQQPVDRESFFLQRGVFVVQMVAGLVRCVDDLVAQHADKPAATDR